MLTKYFEAAMSNAEYKTLDDGLLFGEIPGLEGLWGSGQTLAECMADLRDALEGWVLVGVRLHHPIPAVGGVEFPELQPV